MISRLELESARLRLRQFTLKDLDDCIRFRREVFGIDEPSSSARAWLRWTVDSYRELAKLSQPPYADYALELRDSGEFVGSLGIVPTMVPWGALHGDADDSLLSPEVGLFWGILPGQRRRGYASEGAQVLLDFLFDQLRLRQVVATTEHGNIASQGVMRRLGMTLYANPLSEPAWCQVIGKIAHPR